MTKGKSDGEIKRVMNECFQGPVRGTALIPFGAAGMRTHARTHTHTYTYTHMDKEVEQGHVVQSFNPVHQIEQWVFH